MSPAFDDQSGEPQEGSELDLQRNVRKIPGHQDRHTVDEGPLIVGRVIGAADPCGGRLAEGDIGADPGHVFQVQFSALIQDVGLGLGCEANHHRSFFHSSPQEDAGLDQVAEVAVVPEEGKVVGDH